MKKNGLVSLVLLAMLTGLSWESVLKTNARSIRSSAREGRTQVADRDASQGLRRAIKSTTSYMSPIDQATIEHPAM